MKEQIALQKDPSIPVIPVKRMSFGDCAHAAPSDVDGCFVDKSWTIYIAPQVIRKISSDAALKTLCMTVAHEVAHARQARLKLFTDPKFCDESLPHAERPCEKDAELFAQWVWEEMPDNMKTLK